MREKSFESPIYRAVSIAGSQTALAKQIGVTQGAVWKWLRGLKKISPEHAAAIVEATNGAVQAHELRPDLPKVFPPPAEHDHVS
ncbi:helix-turn-helix domain-containing protein [Xenorhabdus bovienii]|uniref:Predicted antirepressor protein Cro n=1 Tax=Xenorhabdus bovienii str. oregonense TaxID=1398202 RepID=A0A077PB75_XENBV|nr:helix-turn-helix domain-containing protein [Xenorhabdus bovienii]MDE1484325.1 helix-turn-helix domain-containing protein [Xenorhabdus bovienii]MDE1487021.1 helix-turn-helix domain-containing protein [Xenorhabdus bovienii]MDE1493035.1 helix-turn-helix domain-containing protein [Xenorhabdus bovienii]MDE9447633.1 helix-turn-helix domain-containing protein [Xenorhabdus bovienii]MDE9479528.1 helix-turn-helix domain-containing protein [Xenorhabdus bovienii]